MLNETGRPDGGYELKPEQIDSVSGGRARLGIYDPSFSYKDESLAFFRQCVGEETYNKTINSEVGRARNYAAIARAFLCQSDWEKFVWIEEHGSLEGFPE